MGSKLDSESPIIQRVKFVLYQKERSITKFADKIGVAQTTLNQQFIVGKLSLATIENTLNAYPDISAEWLLRGEGGMYKDGLTPELAETKQKLEETTKELKASIDRTNELQAQIQLLNKVINKLLQ